MIGAVDAVSSEMSWQEHSAMFACHCRDALMPEFSSTRQSVYCLGRASSHNDYRYSGYLIPSEKIMACRCVGMDSGHE